MAKLNGLMAEIRTEFPSFRVFYKRSSRLMRAIELFLRIISFGQIRTFFTEYVTTIGNTVYVPDGWKSMSETNRYIILRHERVHMRQARRLTLPLFAFLYLLTPLPAFFAIFRAQFEMEAYGETIRAVAEVRGIQAIRAEPFKEYILDQFRKPAYLWMARGVPGMVENWYYGLVRELEAKEKQS